MYIFIYIYIYIYIYIVHTHTYIYIHPSLSKKHSSKWQSDARGSSAFCFNSAGNSERGVLGVETTDGPERGWHHRLHWSTALDLETDMLIYIYIYIYRVRSSHIHVYHQDGGSMYIYIYICGSPPFPSWRAPAPRCFLAPLAAARALDLRKRRTALMVSGGP